MAGLNQFPGAVVNIKDESSLPLQPQPVKIGISIPTAFGPVAKPGLYPLRSEKDYFKHFGAYYGTGAGQTGWMYARKLLRSGLVELYVNRVASYVAGSGNYYPGSKALAVDDSEGDTETRALVSFIIDGSPEVTTTLTFKVYKPGLPTDTIATVTIPANSVPATTRALILAAIDGSLGYNANFSCAGNIGIYAPIGAGGDANNWTLSITQSVVTSLQLNIGSVGDFPNFSGGVNGTYNGAVLFWAKYLGYGYNNATVTVTKAASGFATCMDITVTMPNGASETVINVPQRIEASDLQTWSDKFEYIYFQGIESGTDAALFSENTFLLSGGYDNAMEVERLPLDSEFEDTDYIGTEGVGNGWAAFNGVQLDYLANVLRPTPAVDFALSQYVQSRIGGMYHCRYYFRAPIGLNDAGLTAYRQATGSYFGTPTDDFNGKFVATDVIVEHPISKNNITISDIAYWLVARAATDLKAGQWISESGEGTGDNTGGGFGSIVDSELKGIAINYYEASQVVSSPLYATLGCNFLVKHPTFGFVLWGNRSASFDTTKLLSKDNIANLEVWLVRQFQPIFEKRTFRSADPKIWYQMYQDAKKDVISILEKGKNGYSPAIVPGEGADKGWQWLGDQKVANKNAVVYNNVADIDAGNYKAEFDHQPLSAMERLSLTLGVFDGTTYNATFNA